MYQHDIMNKDIVFVTGFGPFDNYKINPSWEAVKILPEIEASYKRCEAIENIRLPENFSNFPHFVIEQFPVSYKSVQEAIPEIWKVYKPKLVVHVGVGAPLEKIRIETCAYNVGYIRKDVNDCLPTENCTPLEKSCIHCSLDLPLICKRVQDLLEKSYNIQLSCYAGR